MIRRVYIGSSKSTEYVVADHAPTGRAKCKECKESIEKDSLRMGLCLDDDHFNGKTWYHVLCFPIKKRYRDIDPTKDINEFDKLSKKEANIVIKHIKSEVKKFD